MATLTPVLKLTLPLFDETPWDVEINNDLRIIDGAIGQFFGVPNFAGVWRNAVAFTTGQVVIDPTDASLWTCLTSHTSPAAPTTFPQDRTARPGRWTLQQASAASFANAAAISATQAAASATSAANSAAVVAGAMPRTGGAFTGAVTFAADPTVALGAATKQYVDARVGGVGFLPTSGGTLTGQLNLITPVAAANATRKDYVDTADALRILKSGDTMIGALTLFGPPTAANHAATKAYADLHLPLAGGSMSGALSVSGEIRSITTGRLIAQASGTNTSLTLANSFIGAGLWNSTTVAGAAQLALGQLDSFGVAVSTWSVFTPSSFGIVGNPTLLSNTGSNILSLGPVGGQVGVVKVASPGLAVNDMFFFVQSPVGNRTNWQLRAADGVSLNPVSFVQGVGAYSATSDYRFKTSIADIPISEVWTYINALRPKSFNWVTTGLADYGFIAQDVLAVVPEAVDKAGIEAPDGTGADPDGPDPTLAFRDGCMVAFSVVALQDLQARVTALEAP